MRWSVYFATAAFLWGFPAFVEARENPASAQLVSDVAAIQPGQTFHLAVQMTMQQGWHIYWINPGDAGQATTLTFHGPDGFKIAPRAFPYPSQFDQPGGITMFGYEDKVLFVADVIAPADLKPGASLHFSADVHWLVCKDVCIPGKDQPALELPAGSSSARAENESPLFVDWLARIPVPATDRAEVQTTHEGSRYTLSLRWHDPASHVAVFTVPGDAWQLQDIKLDGDDHATMYSFVTHKLDPTAKLPLNMPVVIVYDNAKGQRQSVQTTVTIEQTH